MQCYHLCFRVSQEITLQRPETEKFILDVKSGADVKSGNTNLVFSNAKWQLDNNSSSTMKRNNNANCLQNGPHLM